MNTTSVGNAFEDIIFEYFKLEIEHGRFLFPANRCKIFKKKGYYSRDRGRDIIFDVTIEVYLPNTDQYSLLIVIECKKYSHPIPVDDVEEFYAKIQQIAPANGKGILASTAPLQAGALNYSKSKGLGHLRHFPDTSFNWELMRSPSTNTTLSLDDAEVARALTSETYVSEDFDYYFSLPDGYSNSLWEFMERLVETPELRSLIRTIKNRQDRRYNVVPIVLKADMEAISTQLLEEAGYVSGRVILKELYQLERRRSGLVIRRNHPKPAGRRYEHALGRILFAVPEIQIFEGADQSIERERFTVAHEMAHLVLGHARYMRSEVFEDVDHEPNPYAESIEDIARMEFQANYLASCLLMPEAHFRASFMRLAQRLELKDKGFGLLFVDFQPHHLRNLRVVLNTLRREYQVSSTALTIRLSALGLLNDTREGYRKLHDLYAPEVFPL